MSTARRHWRRIAALSAFLLIAWGEAGRAAHVKAWADLLQPDFFFGFLILTGLTLQSWLSDSKSKDAEAA